MATYLKKTLSSLLKITNCLTLVMLWEERVPSKDLSRNRQGFTITTNKGLHLPLRVVRYALFYKWEHKAISSENWHKATNLGTTLLTNLAFFLLFMAFLVFPLTLSKFAVEQMLQSWISSQKYLEFLPRLVSCVVLWRRRRPPWRWSRGWTGWRMPSGSLTLMVMGSSAGRSSDRWLL